MSSSHCELLFKTFYESLILQFNCFNRIKNFTINRKLQISRGSFALFFKGRLTEEFFLWRAIITFHILDLFTRILWYRLSTIDSTLGLVVDGLTYFDFILLNLIKLWLSRCYSVFNQVLLFLILANFCWIVLCSCQELLLVWRFILRLLRYIFPHLINSILINDRARQFVLWRLSFFEKVWTLDGVWFWHAFLGVKNLTWWPTIKSISHGLFLSEFLICTLDCLFWPPFKCSSLINNRRLWSFLFFSEIQTSS